MNTRERLTYNQDLRSFSNVSKLDERDNSQSALLLFTFTYGLNMVLVFVSVPDNCLLIKWSRMNQFVIKEDNSFNN
jgi:hypothetical protein